METCQSWILPSLLRKSIFYFTLSTLYSDQVLGRIGSRTDSPELSYHRQPSLVLSNFKPSKDNVTELKDGTLSLRLIPGEVSSLFSVNYGIITV